VLALNQVRSIECFKNLRTNIEQEVIKMTSEQMAEFSSANKVGREIIKGFKEEEKKR
jgi:hypothetical protein